MDGVADIAARFEEALRAGKVRRYQKKSLVDIRPAAPGEVIATVINGEHETVNSAVAGDYVVRGIKGELYIIRPEAWPSVTAGRSPCRTGKDSAAIRQKGISTGSVMKARRLNSWRPGRSI